jgi:glutamyl-tRNA synthetase
LVQLYSLQLPAGEKGDLLIEELKERVKTLKEMKNGVVQLLTPPTSYNPKAVKKFIKGEVPELLRQLKELISKSNPQTPEEWGELIEGFVEEKEVSPRKVMPPLRIALTGDTKGIDLYRMLYILGKEEVLSRLSTLLSSL